MLSLLAKLFGFKKAEPTQGVEVKPAVQEAVEPAPVVAAPPVKAKKPRAKPAAKPAVITAAKPVAKKKTTKAK